LKAKDFMTSNVVTCFEDETIEHAAKLMSNKGFSALPIIDKAGHLVGVVDVGDFVGQEVEVPHALAAVKQLFGQKFYFEEIEELYHRAKKRRLSEVMSKVPRTVTSETSLTTIINKMINKDLKRVLVVDEKKLVGIITRKNLLKAFNQVD